MVSLLVCRSEVADNCLQLIQIEVCKENYPLNSFAVGHVVRKGNSAKRKQMNCIINAGINTAQFQFGLEALKNKDCKAFQRLRKAADAAKDDAKYAVNSQHKSFRICRSVSYLLESKSFRVSWPKPLPL